MQAMIMTSLVDVLTMRRSWSGEVMGDAASNSLYVCTGSAGCPFTYRVGSKWLFPTT